MKIKEPEYGYFNGDINEFLLNRKNELYQWMYDTSKVDRLNIKICYFGGVFHVQKSKVYTGRKRTGCYRLS